MISTWLYCYLFNHMIFIWQYMTNWNVWTIKYVICFSHLFAFLFYIAQIFPQIPSTFSVSNMIEIYKSCSNNYEKLHIYRIISEDADHTDVILKFINQAFHIENDYIYQLNPAKYQTVPQYVIDVCDKYVSTLLESI